MGFGSKGGTTQNTTQTNTPPSWALPALNRAGQEALRLYDQGSGFNTYTGPPRTDLSPQTLAGMNGVLAATGYKGAPVSNQSIQSTVPDVKAIMDQKLAKPPQSTTEQPQTLTGRDTLTGRGVLESFPGMLPVGFAGMTGVTSPRNWGFMGGTPDASSLDASSFPGMLPVGFAGTPGGAQASPALAPGAFSLTQRRGSLW